MRSKRNDVAMAQVRATNPANPMENRREDVSSNVRAAARTTAGNERTTNQSFRRSSNLSRRERLPESGRRVGRLTAVAGLGARPTGGEFGLEAMFFDAPIECAAAETKRLGGETDVSVATLERLANQNGLYSFQAEFVETLRG